MTSLKLPCKICRKSLFFLLWIVQNEEVMLELLQPFCIHEDRAGNHQDLGTHQVRPQGKA